ncbi:MAG: MBL fold metallo-hydrolase, partial [Bacteroidaceae bacterium]|nr:MBL fold metallo-hydrolase [Bacteroidaceae bacterium]
MNLYAHTLFCLEVGQGQSILLQSQGSTFLVDCGGRRDEEAADIAADHLLSQGITRLDGLILTHYDR